MILHNHIVPYVPYSTVVLRTVSIYMYPAPVLIPRRVYSDYFTFDLATSIYGFNIVFSFYSACPNLFSSLFSPPTINILSVQLSQIFGKDLVTHPT